MLLSRRHKLNENDLIFWVKIKIFLSLWNEVFDFLYLGAVTAYINRKKNWLWFFFKVLWSISTDFNMIIVLVIGFSRDGWRYNVILKKCVLSRFNLHVTCTFAEWNDKDTQNTKIYVVNIFCHLSKRWYKVKKNEHRVFLRSWKNSE